MFPLRLSLSALLLLAVLGLSQEAEANDYAGDVVLTENTGPSISGTLNNEGDFLEFGYIIEEVEWNLTDNLRISHFDVIVEWDANGGGGGGRQVTFDVSSENNTAGESQNSGGGGGTISTTWVVNQLPEVVNGTADSAEGFVQSYEMPGEWMGGKFTYTSASAGSGISSESIDYTISLTYYTWNIENITGLPDLFISQTFFSNDNPEIGEAVTITAEIRLHGANITGNFSVGFYLGATNGTEIGFQEVNGSKMTMGGRHLASINWTAINGSHTIYAVVNPNGLIYEGVSEAALKNNELSKDIRVGLEEDTNENSETTDTTEETTTDTEESGFCPAEITDENKDIVDEACVVPTDGTEESKSEEDKGILPSSSFFASICIVAMIAFRRR